MIDYGKTDSDPLEHVHQTLQTLVQNALSDGLVPICLGGGNDQSAANGMGWINYWRTRNAPDGGKRKLVTINVDAHLDVRPLIYNPGEPHSYGLAHSGSPFLQLVEATSGVEDFKLIEFASQGQQCAAAHVDYVIQHGGQIVWLSELGEPHQSRCIRNNSSGAVKRLRQILEQCIETDSRVFFSFDMDAICASDCPGVSCPSPIGLTASEALGLCYEAGKCPMVDLMDLSEFNPRIESSQTGRLLINMIYHFLLGYAERP
ncbi:unnamed protein product [Echinostoma caproni]|uniref:Arginase domain-containing protein n=1 Tax=Echinostoma caproni TaxID=27848 RepID=A0A3P8INA5_9TREM|nr:unnamed protein product [Echinostoma caproni]